MTEDCLHNAIYVPQHSDVAWEMSDSFQQLYILLSMLHTNRNGNVCYFNTPGHIVTAGGKWIMPGIGLVINFDGYVKKNVIAAEVQTKIIISAT